jgi:hypothetical protein
MILWQVKCRVIKITCISKFSEICKLHIQISNEHMCIFLRPASQVAVKNAYTLRQVYIVVVAPFGSWFMLTHLSGKTEPAKGAAPQNFQTLFFSSKSHASSTGSYKADLKMAQ